MLCRLQAAQPLAARPPTYPPVHPAQCSEAVVDRYLRGGFDGNPELNLARAAAALYELQAKLRGAASKSSEDMKAPLKAIRNAMDRHAYNRWGGWASGQAVVRAAGRVAGCHP